jgi:hypothetical protein
VPIKVRLTEGEELLIDVNLDEWNKAFQRAAASNGMLEIEDSRGRVLAINPDRVLFLEEVSQEEREPTRQAQPAAS